MLKITDLELKRINEERRRRKYPRLTFEQAQQIVSAQATITPQFDVTSFLIGFATGHSNFTAEGALGAAMHPRSGGFPVAPDREIGSVPQSGPAPQPDPAPSYNAPDPSPPSYDSSSSAASFTSDNGGNI